MEGVQPPIIIIVRREEYRLQAAIAYHWSEDGAVHYPAANKPWVTLLAPTGRKVVQFIKSVVIAPIYVLPDIGVPHNFKPSILGSIGNFGRRLKQLPYGVEANQYILFELDKLILGRIVDPLKVPKTCCRFDKRLFPIATFPNHKLL